MKPMLAEKYIGQDIAGWLMSEKLDGVRAIWDGSKLISKNGNVIRAPKSFLDALPKSIALDGELYIGRGQLQKIASIIKKKSPIDSDWAQISYRVFDAPNFFGSFKSRLEYCRTILINCRIAAAVDHVQCNSKRDLDVYFKSLVDAGAEGVMIRAPNSRYDHFRSQNLLKHKPKQTDEAKVIGFSNGVLVCDWQGKIFELAIYVLDMVGDRAVRLGELVTFNFSGLTDAGIPRNATYVCARNYE